MGHYLVVVDMQNDFITGVLGTPEAVSIVPKISEKICSNLYDRIIFTKDTHHPNYLKTNEGQYLPCEHCIRDTPGWDFCDVVKTCMKGLEVETCIIEKATFGSLSLKSYIPYSAESVELIGVCTDICVITNALILKTLLPETKIIVNAACCAGTSPENHHKALNIMEQCQVEIIL